MRSGIECPDLLYGLHGESPTRSRNRRPAASPAGRRRRSLPRPRQGFPIRRAPAALRAGLRARRDRLARAGHRRQHGHLPAPRRRAPAQPAGPTAGRAHQRQGPAGRLGPHRQFLRPLAAIDVAALGSHPRRAEGVLEARGLERGSRQPGLRRTDALCRGPLGQRHVLRHRRRRAAAGPAPGSLRRPARVPLAFRRPERAVLAATARRARARSRRNDRDRGTPLRDRGHRAGPLLRRRGGARLRRGAPDVHRGHPRGVAADRETLGLVALRDRAAGARVDAREGERAPRRDLQGNLRGLASRGLRRRGREVLPRVPSVRQARLDRLLRPARRLRRPAVAAPGHLGARPPDRLREHREPDGRPRERCVSGKSPCASPWGPRAGD